MSWVQGIQERKDLPAKFVEYAEKKYFDIFGIIGYLEYITWFGFDKEFIADFGTEHSIKFKLNNSPLL